MSTEPKEAAPMPALVERLREMYAAAYPAGQNDQTELGKERFALAFAAVNALPGLLDRIASLEAEVAALRKDAERREGVVATLQETCEIYERRLSASEPVAALATRLSAARAAHNDLLCDPKATTVQFIGSRDRLLFTWAALDSAIAAKGK